MILRVAWCGARAVWRPGLRARGIAVVVPGIDGGALPLVSREGGCCYGGRAARAASVWRRRFLVLGGSPAAARRALSAWRSSRAVRIRWLRTVSRQPIHSVSGVTPMRRHQPRAMLVVAGSLMVEKVRPEPVRRA